MTKDEKIKELISLMTEVLEYNYKNLDENELDKMIIQVSIYLETEKRLRGGKNVRINNNNDI